MVPTALGGSQANGQLVNGNSGGGASTNPKSAKKGRKKTEKESAVTAKAKKAPASAGKKGKKSKAAEGMAENPEVEAEAEELANGESVAPKKKGRKSLNVNGNGLGLSGIDGTPVPKKKRGNPTWVTQTPVPS